MAPELIGFQDEDEENSSSAGEVAAMCQAPCCYVSSLSQCLKTILSTKTPSPNFRWTCTRHVWIRNTHNKSCQCDGTFKTSRP